jgi:hypothetical protein
MRLTATLILATLLATPVLAQDPNLLLYEGFDYTISETLSDNVLQGKIPPPVNSLPSVTWNKAGSPTPVEGADPATDRHRVIADSFSYPGLEAPSGGRLDLPLVQNGNTTKISLPGGPYNHNSANQSVFFSFALTLKSFFFVDDGLGAGQAGDDVGNFAMQKGAILAGFTASSGVGAGMTGANVYAGQLRARREVDVNGVQSGKYQLGFMKNNLSGNVATWDITQSFAVDDLLLIVGEYQFNADGDENTVTDDAVRLWINPIPGEAAPVENVFSNTGFDVSTSGGASQSNAAAFYIQTRTSSPPQVGAFELDELRIGTTYASVTPAGSAFEGDVDGDGLVDGTDFLLWQRGLSPGGLTDGDLQIWKDNFPTAVAAAGTVPEPSTWALGALAALAIGMRRRFAA